MADHICPVCEKIFVRKQHLDYHLYKKKVKCNSPPKKKLIQKKRIHICNFCDTTFTRKDSLNRHIEHRCKKRYLNDKHYDNTEMIKKIISELDDIKKENEYLKNTIKKLTQKINQKKPIKCKK